MPKKGKGAAQYTISMRTISLGLGTRAPAASPAPLSADSRGRRALASALVRTGLAAEHCAHPCRRWPTGGRAGPDGQPARKRGATGESNAGLARACSVCVSPLASKGSPAHTCARAVPVAAAERVTNCSATSISWTARQKWRREYRAVPCPCSPEFHPQRPAPALRPDRAFVRHTGLMPTEPAMARRCRRRR